MEYVDEFAEREDSQVARKNDGNGTDKDEKRFVNRERLREKVEAEVDEDEVFRELC